MADTKIVGGKIVRESKHGRHKKKHHKEPDFAGCRSIKSPVFIPVCREHGDKPCDCEPSTKKDGIDIYVQDVGKCVNGTIVLVSGTIDALYFLYQVANLSARGYRVITVTIRGNGKSDQPFTPYNVDVWADDLKQVLDCLDVHDVTLVGHSTGSATALHYVARHHAHRVSKLVLTATLAVDPTFVQSQAFVDGLVAAAAVDFPATVASLVPLLFFPQVPSTATFDFILNLLLETNHYVDDQQAPYVLRQIGLDNTLLNDLPHVHIPTLILHGVSDIVTPFGIALQLQAGIAGSQLVPFTLSGHFLLITENVLYSNQIAAFAGTSMCHPHEEASDPLPRTKKLVDWHPTEGPQFEE
jgi:non-heme chloroperoxidase